MRRIIARLVVVAGFASACSLYGEPLPPAAEDDAPPPRVADGAATDGAGADATVAEGSSVIVADDAAATHERFVFVTRALTKGDFGGFAGGDARCNAAARAGATIFHGRTFRAWLSVDGIGPDKRFVHGSAAYVRGDGVLIAASWADLVDGSLLAPLNIDENLQTVLGDVWTGTAANGAALDPECNGWLSGGDAETGIVGSADNPTAFSDFIARPCSTFARLYCFED